MKKNHAIILFRMVSVFALLVGVVSILCAQIDPNGAAYDEMKRSGQLPLTKQSLYTGEYPEVHPSVNPSRSGLLISLDGTFTVAMDRNDDWSTGLINLPWTFCFYGTDQTSLYINNNGNISFGGSYYQYTPSGFPLSGFPMIAAFWADVDTRNTSSGLVYYRIETSPNRLTVIWDQVGYYFYHADKLCTFELIITDGMDPLIGIGNNVAFCYDNMDWTTGDASGGSGGFGGSPATVGINKGDGSTFAQVGRFNKPGVMYDGPGGLADGVDYLDSKTFFFSTCNFVNIPPAPTGFPQGPVTIYIGDTYNLTVQFLSPEVNQTTTTTVDAGTLSDFTYTSTPGNVSTVVMQLIGTCGNAGMNTIHFAATDDGDPVETTYVDLVIYVVDMTPPEITCPDDVTYNCVADIPELDPYAAMATDNCSAIITVTETSNGGYGCMTSPLILNRFFTATDPGGNTASCNQVITVATPPVIFTAPPLPKCDASMSAYWDCTNPNCVEVTATKELSNIVLRDCHGTHFKFDNLNQGNSGTFCHPSGLPVTTVWIKAGCYKSGDGPGYGRRFNAPCDYCPELRVAPVDESTPFAKTTFGINVYPNPTNGEFTLMVNSGYNSAINVSLYDLTGKKILDVPNVNPNQPCNITYKLPQGIYLIRIEQNGMYQSVRLIKN